jgi:hypothetical protein
MFLLTIFFFIGCAGVDTKSDNSFDERNGVRTEKRHQDGILSDPGKKGLVCYAAKLCWMGSVWQRQITTYNDAPEPPMSVKETLLDYVYSLPSPHFGGKEKYETLFRTEVLCRDEMEAFDFSDKWRSERQKMLKFVGETSFSGDLVKDKSNAKVDALKKAAEHFGVIVESSSEYEDFLLVRDRVSVKVNKIMQFVPLQGVYKFKQSQKIYEFTVAVWPD